MTARRSSIPVAKVIWALVRNQPIRYSVSLLAFTTLWTMPIVAGLIAAAFFDSLTDQGAGVNMVTIVVAMWAWALARIAVLFVAMRTHSSVLFRAGASMRGNMLAWIYSLPGAQGVAESPGEVVSRFRDDVEHTLEAYDFTVDLIGSSLSAIVGFIVLFLIDPFITMIVLTPLLLIIIVVSRTGTVIRRYRTAARDSTEAITGFLGETLASVQSVKVAGAEGSMLSRFDRLNHERRKMMVRDRTLTAGLEAVFFNAVSIGTGLILLLAAGSLETSGSAGITIGQFALFVFVLEMVTESAYFIGLFLARFKQAGVSLERMVALARGATWRDLVIRRDLTMEPEPTKQPDGLPVQLERLEVRGLSFSYNGNGAAIRDIDLDIGRGEFVVVTGKIGSGKTTLLRAILGLVPTDGGSISWNGVPVAEPAAAMVPPRAAYTPQVPRLFSMTLGDNVLLGMNAAEAATRDALATAMMGSDLEAMPDGLETMVGPKGVRLSGGQIQRTATARMLVRLPQLLVFDDLSSALDVETEADLWERLFSQQGEATALVVSHRRPAMVRADRIIVLEAGTVVASGTADELRESSEEFRRLWASQQS